MLAAGAVGESLDIPLGQTVTLPGGAYEFTTVNLQGTLLLQGDTTITVTGAADQSGYSFRACRARSARI